MKTHQINANPKLPLPDGRLADDLRLGELFHEMERLGIPGISATMGKLELLGCYEGALLSRQEAAARIGGDRAPMGEVAKQIGTHQVVRA